MQDERKTLMELISRKIPPVTLDEVEKQLNKIAKKFQSFKPVLDFFTYSNEPSLARSRRSINAERTFVNQCYARFKQAQTAGQSAIHLRADFGLFARQLAASHPPGSQSQLDPITDKQPPKAETVSGFSLNRHVQRVPAEMVSPVHDQGAADKGKDARLALQDVEKNPQPLIKVIKAPDSSKKSDRSDTLGLAEHEQFMSESISKEKSASIHSPSAPTVNLEGRKAQSNFGNRPIGKWASDPVEEEDPVSKHNQKREVHRRQSEANVLAKLENPLFSTLDGKKSKLYNHEIYEESEKSLSELDRSDLPNKLKTTSALLPNFDTIPRSSFKQQMSNMKQPNQSKKQTEINSKRNSKHLKEAKHDQTSIGNLGNHEHQDDNLKNSVKFNMKIINSPREIYSPNDKNAQFDSTSFDSDDFKSPRELDVQSESLQLGQRKSLSKKIDFDHEMRLKTEKTLAIANMKWRKSSLFLPNLTSKSDLNNSNGSELMEFHTPRSLKGSLVLPASNQHSPEQTLPNNSFGPNMGSRTNLDKAFSSSRPTGPEQVPVQGPVKKVDLASLNLNRLTEQTSIEQSDRHSPFFAGGEAEKQFQFGLPPQRHKRLGSVAPDLDSSSALVVELQAKQKATQQELGDLKKKYSELQVASRDHLSVVAHLETQISSSKGVREALERQLDTLRQENSILKSTVLSLKQNESHLHNIIENSNPLKLETLNQEVTLMHKKEIDHFIGLVERLNQRIGALSAENDSLKTISKSNHSQELEGLSAQNHRLTEQLRSRERAEQSLKSQIADLQQETDSLGQQLSRAERSNQQLASELAARKKSDSRLATANAEAEARVSDLSAKLRDLAADFEVLSRAYDTAKAQGSDAVRSRELIGAEVGKLKRELEAREKERISIELQKERDSISNLEMSTMRHTLATSELCLDRQSKELFILKDQNDLLKSELKTALEAKACLLGENEDLKGQLTQQTNKIGHFKSKIDQYEKEKKCFDSFTANSHFGFNPSTGPESRAKDLVIKETGSQWAHDALRYSIPHQILHSHSASRTESKQDVINMDFDLDNSDLSHPIKDEKDKEKSVDSNQLSIDPTAFIGGLLESIDEVIEMTNRMSETSQDHKCTRRSLESAFDSAQRDGNHSNSNKSNQELSHLRNYNTFLRALSTSKALESNFKKTCIHKEGSLFSSSTLQVALVDFKVLGYSQGRNQEVAFRLKVQSGSSISAIQTSVVNYRKILVTSRSQEGHAAKIHELDICSIRLFYQCRKS